jgi:hypothetical protein
MPTDIEELQRSLNRFTDRYLVGVRHLQVDGDKGHATNSRLTRVKWYLGYGGSAQKSAKVTPEFVRRMRHPHSLRYSSPKMLAAGANRRRLQRKHARASAKPRDGVASFDGKPVAAWLVPYLTWARDNGWHGVLVSGYRTPEYSQHLCYGICGAPRCPGLCAGTSSNHTKYHKPEGAVDVSDYVTFASVIARCPYSPRIFNNLPRDRVHFSSTGG